MKVIIAGSRDLLDQRLVNHAVVRSLFDITEVVSGRAQGIDTLGENWANSKRVHIEPFAANWDDVTTKPCKVKYRQGRPYNALAGFARNQQMADYADALIAITNGSKGTRDMINRALNRGLKVYVENVEKLRSGWYDYDKRKWTSTYPYSKEV